MDDRAAPKSNPFSSQTQKMTFGVPQEQEKKAAIERQTFGSAYEHEESES
jgi:hypothetical protein